LSSVNAQSANIIHFDGFPEGTILDSVSVGSGVSGPAVSGTVGLFGLNPHHLPDRNHAVVLDSTCNGAPSADGCRPEDRDMYFPELNNTFIIARSLADSNNDGLVD